MIPSRLLQRGRNHIIPKICYCRPSTITNTSSSSYKQTTIRWAGHNKWSKIKHKKGAKDLHKNKLFSKATKAIRVASKACNGDLQNLYLQSAIQAARNIQVPKDRIEDAIQNNKMMGSSEADVLSQRYDGQIVTPAGKIAIIILALTDNKNRTAANVRTYLKKAKGDLLNTGSNNFFFDHLGIALIHKHKNDNNDDNNDNNDNDDGIGDDDSKKKNKSDYDTTTTTTTTYTLSDDVQDDIIECALDAGAIDVDFGTDSDEHFLVKCQPSDLHPLVTAMKSNGYTLSEFNHAYLVKDENEGGTTIELDQESTDLFETFLMKMDEDDDVTSVYHNATLLFDSSEDNEY